MILTLQEVMDTCKNWDLFCKLHGIGEYAVAEGYGDTTITLSTDQAHWLGIVVKIDWKLKPFEEVYPNKKEVV